MTGTRRLGDESEKGDVRRAWARRGPCGGCEQERGRAGDGSGRGRRAGTGAGNLGGGGVGARGRAGPRDGADGGDGDAGAGGEEEVVQAAPERRLGPHQPAGGG